MRKTVAAAARGDRREQAATELVCLALALALLVLATRIISIW